MRTYRRVTTSDIEVRADGGLIVVRASNDRLVDAYNTRITVEALTEWAEGFLQHRYVNLEHDAHRFAGIAEWVDFTPDLVVGIRAIPEVVEAVKSGEITGASLEFVPLEGYVEEGGVEVYTRLSPEPELTGLALTERPAVPGAKVLEVRGVLPLWAYAVIDPVVWERGPAPQYLYFPHHRIDKRRTVDEGALSEALARIEARAFEVAKDGSLDRDEIASRAIAHLERHYRHGLLMRAQMWPGFTPQVRGVVPSDPEGAGLDESSPWEAPTLSDFTDAKWDELTREEKIAIAKHFAWAPKMPPDRFDDLKLPHHDPKTKAVVWRGVVAAMASLMGARGGVDIPEEDRRRVYEHLARHYRQFDKPPPEYRSMMGEEATEMAEQEKLTQDTKPAVEESPAQGVEGRTAAPTHSTPDIAGLIREAVREALAEIVPKGKTPQVRGTGPVYTAPQVRISTDRTAATAELLYRTLRNIGSPAPDPHDLLVIDQISEDLGLQQRAITLAGNSAVISQEVLREIWRAPAQGHIFRSHFRVNPHPGVKKVRGAVFEGSFDVTWNRGRGTPINESGATHRQVDIELYSLEAATTLDADFTTFNILGPAWVQDVFLPALREAIQEAEDRLLFLGSAPLNGLTNEPGAVSVAYDLTSGTALDGLRALVSALPPRFKAVRSDVAIYAKSDIVNTALSEIARRQTDLGDSFLVGTNPGAGGPDPVFSVAGFNVYYAPALDSAPAQLAAVAVNRRYAIYAAEGVSLEVRSFPVPGFQTRYEFQEWIGWGFVFPEAVARLILS